MTGRGGPDAALPRIDTPLALAWETRNPQRRAEELRAAGLEVRDGRFRVGPVVVALTASDDERLLPIPAATAGEARRPEVRPPAALPEPSLGWVVLALAIATVDAERAARELAITHPEPRPRDPHLGARVLAGLGSPLAIALVEPDTEARLAATLARHGEGPVGLYLVRGGSDPAPGGAPGPFGPQRLLALDGPPWAPVLIRVRAAGGGDHPAGTIER